MESGSGNGVAQAGFNVSVPLRSLTRTVRAVVIEPGRFFRVLCRQEAPDNPVLFAGVFLLISLLLPGVLALLNPLLPDGLDFAGLLGWIPGDGFGAVASALVLLPLLVLCGLYLFVAVQHLFVVIFVRRGGGFDATLCALAYSSVLAPLEAIPVLGYLATLYVIYISYVGVRELHATTTVRALLAVLAFNALLWMPQIVSLFRSLSDRVFG